MSNAWVTYPLEGDKPGKPGPKPHKALWGNLKGESLADFGWSGAEGGARVRLASW